MPDPRHRLREFSDEELRLIAGLTYDGALQARISEEALIEIGRRIELDAELDALDEALVVPRDDNQKENDA